MDFGGIDEAIPFPVWTGCASARERSKPGSVIVRNAKFWLPILALG